MTKTVNDYDLYNVQEVVFGVLTPKYETVSPRLLGTLKASYAAVFAMKPSYRAGAMYMTDHLTRKLGFDPDSVHYDVLTDLMKELATYDEAEVA